MHKIEPPRNERYVNVRGGGRGRGLSVASLCYYCKARTSSFLFNLWWDVDKSTRFRGIMGRASAPGERELSWMTYKEAFWQLQWRSSRRGMIHFGRQRLPPKRGSSAFKQEGAVFLARRQGKAMSSFLFWNGVCGNMHHKRRPEFMFLCRNATLLTEN